MDQRNVSIITFIVIVILFVLRDWFNEPIASNRIGSGLDSNSKSNDDEGDKVFWKPIEGGPGSKFASAKFIGPSIRILYCHSSGYKNAYDQYSEFIVEKYPQILVEGLIYPVELPKRLAAHALTVLKFSLLGTLLLTQLNFLRSTRLPLPFITWLNENKLYVAMLSFFLFNLLENHLGSSGAFEVYFDDVPVWSKLQTGRLPNPGELVQMIENHLKLGSVDPPVFHLSTTTATS